jgi:DNA-binding MarR family transcriptional regulator
MAKRHKADTKTFEEETYVEQAKTINAEIVHLGKAIKANIRRALLERKKSPKDKRIKNLEALIERIRNYNP